MFLKPLNEGKTTSKVSLLLVISSLCPLSSFPLVYAFANVLMRCVVTMVSNVSDSLDARPGMLLHAHMLQHSLMPHRPGCRHTGTRTLRGMPFTTRPCATYLCARTQRGYACKSAKWCVSGRNSCSFLREKRNFLLPRCKPRPVSQDISQSAMSGLSAGS